MPLLRNVTFDVEGQVFNTSTGQTTLQRKLVGITGCLSMTAAADYQRLGETVLTLPYKVYVASSLSIVLGDRLLNMVSIATRQVWPPIDTPTAFWQVGLTEEVAPGLIPCRVLYISRQTGAGVLGSQ